MKVRRVAAVMVEAEAVRGESAASAAAAEALHGGAKATDVRHGVAAWRGGAAAEAVAALCNATKRRSGRLAFERDGIDIVLPRDARRVSPAEKEFGVCRRRRRSSHGDDRHQCARSSPWQWRPASARQVDSAVVVTTTTMTSQD
ncbi:hypothetical protein ACQJBY_071992 [Aegilops geniculata]